MNYNINNVFQIVEELKAKIQDNSTQLSKATSFEELEKLRIDIEKQTITLTIITQQISEDSL